MFNLIVGALSYLSHNAFSYGDEDLYDILDEVGEQIKPSKRLWYAKRNVVISIFNDRYSANIEIISILPGHNEYSSVGMYWNNFTCTLPKIHCNWNQLSGLTNYHANKYRRLWIIPQELMEPLYNKFKVRQRY